MALSNCVSYLKQTPNWWRILLKDCPHHILISPYEESCTAIPSGLKSACTACCYIWCPMLLRRCTYHSTKLGATFPYTAQATEMSSGEITEPPSTICQMPQAIVDVSSSQVTMWIQMSLIGETVIFFLPAHSSSVDINIVMPSIFSAGISSHTQPFPLKVLALFVVEKYVNNDGLVA